MRSFRLQIAALSILCSGIVLAVFGASAWALIHRRGIAQIDQDIQARADRLLPLFSRPFPGVNHEIPMRFILGQEAIQDTIIWVRDGEGGTRYKSRQWPDELSVFVAPPEGGTPNGLTTNGLAMIDPEFPEGPPDFMFPFPPPDDFGGPPPFEFGPPPRLRPPPHRWISPLRTWPAGNRDWRIGVVDNGIVTMAIGTDLRAFAADMAGVRNAFFVATPIALLLIAAGALLLAHRTMRPVLAIAETAEQITARALDQRIPAGRQATEFQRLIIVFNRMMDRLERSFGQAVRFSADAAHELKTPVTVLKGKLEQAVGKARDGSPEQRLFNDLLEETHRLGIIIERLLLLARADAGTLKLRLSPVDLSEILEGISEDASIMAPSLRLESEIAPGVVIPADSALLRQALHNLVSNAIKYNFPGGLIRLRLEDGGPEVRFAISNTGPGIPETDRPRVFDRFYRADPSRSRMTEGLGLGLSLAREIVSAHRGELVLADAADGLTTFVMTLPKNAVAPAASL